jgi:hypothetical protein
MTKRKNESSSSGQPIANRVIAQLDSIRKRKVVNIDALTRAKLRADELEATIASDEKLSQLDPLHAVYVYGQNKMSIFVEQLAGLPAVSKLTDAYLKAEEAYMPSGPPMSPLTLSYFSCWGFFDLCVGAKRESFGTIMIAFCKAMNVGQGLVQVFEIMQASRMGLYVHEGSVNDRANLRELITGKKITAIVPSGHKGLEGEIWLARIMPEPFGEGSFGYSVVLTTPYVIGRLEKDFFYRIGDEGEWNAFFDRTFQKIGNSDRNSAYEELMKYGLNRHYWNEYIFEAYVNYGSNAIYVTGFPDIPLSRPHSRESQARRGE